MYDPLEQFNSFFAVCTKIFTEKNIYIYTIISIEDFFYIFLIFFLFFKEFKTNLIIKTKYYSSEILTETFIQNTNISVSNDTNITDSICFITNGFLYLSFTNLIFSNILGIIPFNVATTAIIISNLLGAFGFYIYINISGIFNKKLQLLNILLPNGTPVPIIPFIILIETISYITKIISLAVRIFANMTAGHILLEIICTFIITMFCSLYATISISIIFFILIILIILLEVLVSLLQSYVYVTISIIFINDIFLNEH